MDITPLNDRLSVSPQIALSDLPALAQAGFRSVICNRPDGESPDQPAFAVVQAAAEAAGLQAAWLPVTPGCLTPPHVEAFEQLLQQLPGPVLAYCRTGMRSASLWNLLQSRSCA